MTTDIILQESTIDLIGDLTAKAAKEKPSTIEFNSTHGNITLGGGNADGDLILKNNKNVARIHLDGGNSAVTNKETVRVFVDGRHGNINLGGNGADGDLVLMDRGGAKRIHIDGGDAAITDKKKVRVFIDGKNGNITLGGDGQGGKLSLNDAQSQNTITFAGKDGTIVATDLQLKAIGSLLAKLQTLESRIQSLELPQ